MSGAGRIAKAVTRFRRVGPYIEPKEGAAHYKRPKTNMGKLVHTQLIWAMIIDYLEREKVMLTPPPLKNPFCSGPCIYCAITDVCSTEMMRFWHARDENDPEKALHYARRTPEALGDLRPALRKLDV